MKCRYRSHRGAATLFAAGLLLAVGHSGNALAAIGGCNGVNAGGFDITAATTPSDILRSIPGFKAGDTITFVLTHNDTSGPSKEDYLNLGTGSNLGDLINGFKGNGSASYTVTGSGDTTLHEELIVGGYTAGSPSLPDEVSVSATCVAGSTTGNTGAAQVRTTELAAANAATLIGGSVRNAINETFDGGNPLSVGPGRIALFFASETPRQRFDDAFAGALDYAEPGRERLPPTAAPAAGSAFDRMWNVWADVRAAGWDGQGAASGTNGTQINLTAGIGRKLTPDIVVGLLGGYEHFNAVVDSVDGTLTGDGGSVGGYLGWRLHGLKFTAAAVWTGLSYQGTAGSETGSFDGSRWLVSGDVSGSRKTGGFEWTPSAHVLALWESQSAYTDSASVAHAAQSFMEGQVSGGLKLAYPWTVASGAVVTPFVGAYGDYRFDGSIATSATQAVVSPEGVSGRVTTGVAVRSRRGATATLDGAIGGLGGGYLTWSANARFGLQF